MKNSGIIGRHLFATLVLILFFMGCENGESNKSDTDSIDIHQEPDSDGKSGPDEKNDETDEVADLTAPDDETDFGEDDETADTDSISENDTKDIDNEASDEDENIITVPEDAIWVDSGSTAENPDGSKEKPFPTIALALDASKEGSTIVVKEGVYEEQARHFKDGLPDKPFTLMANPGEKVIVSGMRKVSGWEAVGNGVFKTTLDEKPDRLFTGLNKQKLSREPNEGWWKAEKVKQSEGKGTLIAPAYLKGFDKDINGGEVYIWAQNGNNFFTTPVKSVSPDEGHLNLTITNEWLKLTDGDKFYLVNHPSLIDQPGEWAAISSGEKFELYFKPNDEADLEHIQVPVETRETVRVHKRKNIKISGLDFVGSKAYGITVTDSENIAIENCSAYLNGKIGFQIRDTKNSIVSNNLSMQNGHGIGVSYSNNVLVQKNEIAFNDVDGLLISWDSTNIEANSNYVHDHILWGHPDNMQMYRNVEDIRIINNLVITSGQSFMISEAKNLTFRGNMFIGSGAYMLILGHEDTTDAVIENNTFAYSGYGNISFTAKNYTAKENIFVKGNQGSFYSIRGVKNYSGDYNLFWTGEGIYSGIVDDDEFHPTIEAYQQNNPTLDVHSLYSDPEFINAPAYFKVVDTKKLENCEKEKLYLRSGTETFSVNDNIEINFDGIVRKVKEVTDEYITFEPALSEKPIKGYLVSNWKENENFDLDLGLSSQSPGMAMGENGGQVGSKISIEAFRRADFDNDGKRDVPDFPSFFKHSW